MRLTEASNAPINGQIVTEEGIFPFALLGSMERIRIPGVCVDGFQMDTPELYQVMATSIDGREFNLFDAEFFEEIPPIESIRITDGFVFVEWNPSISWKPLYENETGIYPSGFSVIQSMPPADCYPIPYYMLDEDDDYYI